MVKTLTIIKKLFELKDGSGLVKEYNIKDNIIFEGHYKNGEKMEEE